MSKLVKVATMIETMILWAMAIYCFWTANECFRIAEKQRQIDSRYRTMVRTRNLEDDIYELKQRLGS